MKTLALQNRKRIQRLPCTCNAGDPASITGSGRSAGEGIGYLLQYFWTYLVAQMVKSPPAMRETWVWSLSWEDPLEKERLPISVFWPEEFRGLYSHGVTKSWTQLSDFHFHRELGPCQVVLVVKNPLASAGDVRNMGSIPGSERSPGAGHGNPLQYSRPQNPMDRGAWQAMVLRVTKSRTHLQRLSMYT